MEPAVRALDTNSLFNSNEATVTDDNSSAFCTGGSGTIDLELSKTNLKKLCEVWSAQPSQNILVDLRDRTIEFSPRDVELLVDVVAETGLGIKNRVAFVYKYRAPFDPANFFEFLATRKGMQIRAFEDFEEVISWLEIMTAVSEKTA